MALRGTALRTSRRSPCTWRAACHIGSPRMGSIGSEAETKTGKRGTRGRRRGVGRFSGQGRSRSGHFHFFQLFFLCPGVDEALHTDRHGENGAKGRSVFECGPCNSEDTTFRPSLPHTTFFPFYLYILVRLALFVVSVRGGGSTFFSLFYVHFLNGGFRRGSSLYYYTEAKKDNWRRGRRGTGRERISGLREDA